MNDWIKGWFTTAALLALISWTIGGIWWGASLTAQVKANDTSITAMAAQVDWIYHFLLNGGGK